jgi:hypothetical protein
MSRRCRLPVPALLALLMPLAALSAAENEAT